MANITFSIPDKLYADLKRHSYIKWSNIIRKTLVNSVNSLDKIDVLKEFESAEKDIKAGKGIPFSQVKAELGFDDDL